MKLIDLLVKELPRRGGWPEGAGETIEMHMDGDVFFDGDRAPDEFTLPQCSDGWAPGMGFFSNEVTREQYESALAASEGWIEWGGGECPVPESANVDIKLECGSEKSNAPACSFIWQHSEDVYAIIAYRLHKPDLNSRANDDRLEQDLNECIGQDVDVPEWNGDGVPPIGCECEMQDSKGAWIPVDIIAKNDGFTFGWSYDYRIVFFGDKADEFRPLRTEAERAREDVETAIRTCLAGTGAGITPLAAKGIYEAIAAGKIPGVKLEDK